MIKIRQDEVNAIRMVVDFGQIHGYGNLIAHLQSAWAKQLILQYKMDEASAIEATQTRVPYPLQMHEEILSTGQYDERGGRYR